MKHKLLLSVLSILSFLVLKSQYCMPETNCTVGDGVVEFGMGSFYNPSGCSADFGIPGYADYTDLIVPVGQGNTETVLLRSDFGSQQISIWIDADNSESFEASELILTDEPVGVDQVITSVTIPATLAFGEYIMRVQAAYATPSSPDPCVVATWGETEDYTVSVGPPPSCIAVNSVQAGMIGSDQAEISWIDGGTASVWDIEFGPIGFIPTGQPSPGYDDVSNPVMLTGLNPATEYQVYVRADCGMDNTSDVSFWSIPVSFVTECASITPFYLNDMNSLPLNCWEFANGGDLTQGPQFQGFSNWFDGGFANNGFTGSQGATFFGFNQFEWMMTPFFDLSAGPYQVEFDVALTESFGTFPVVLGSDDFLSFAYSDDLGATWNEIETWDASNPLDPVGMHFVQDISAINGNEVRFAFLGSNGLVDDFVFFEFHVDNFVVQDLGACVATYNVQATNISSDAAEITWVDPGMSSAWDIEWGPTGFIPTGIPSPGYDDVPNPAMISGLDPLTSYDVYVRADCGMDNSSDISFWSSVVTFTTACANFAPTYIEDFNGFPLDCWESANGGNIDEGPQNFDFSNWFDGGFANLNGFTGAQRVSFFGAQDFQWLLSPFIDLSGGDYQMEFDFALTAAFNASPITLGSDDKVAVLITEDFGANWEVLQEWDSSSSVTFSGEHLIYDLSAYSNTNTRFAFYATTDSINDFINFQVHVDNFRVQDLNAPIEFEVDAVNDLNCFEDGTGAIFINVSGGTAPYTFEWSNGAGTEDLVNVQGGDYSLTITDGAGTVVTSDVYTINQPEEIIVTAVVTDESLNGANDGAIDITVEGGTGPYGFSWNDGSPNEDIANLEDGLWCVNVFDAFGCTQFACFNVAMGPSDVNNIDDLSAFTLFPNPTNDQLTMNAEFTKQKNISILLRNNLGQIIRSHSFNTVNQIFHTWDVSDFSAGMYFFEIRDLESKQYSVQKVIIR
ncbi:MAG: GEVED domain-containing protein [Bacteroidota bacterium]